MASSFPGALDNLNDASRPTLTHREVAEAVEATQSHLGVDSGWITPTLGSSWVNYASGHVVARYRRKGGILYMQGLIKNGGVGVLFNIPAGFRPYAGGPVETLIFAINTSTGIGRVDVLTNGDVVFQSGGTPWASLSGITYPID